MEKYSPEPLKRIAVLKDLRYGVEIEFPYRKKDEKVLLYNFNHYNNKKLNNQWKFNKELTNEYPKGYYSVLKTSYLQNNKNKN